MSMFLTLSLEKTKNHPERRILAFLHGIFPQCMPVRRSQVGVLSEECNSNRGDLEKVEWRQLTDLKQTESISEGCLHSSRNGKATEVFRHRERACLAESVAENGTEEVGMHSWTFDENGIAWGKGWMSLNWAEPKNQNKSHPSWAETNVYLPTVSFLPLKVRSFRQLTATCDKKWHTPFETLRLM